MEMIMNDTIANICVVLAPLLTKYVSNADDFRFRFDNNVYRAEALINDNWETILILKHLNDFGPLDETDLENIRMKTEGYFQNRKDAQHAVRSYV